MSQVELEGEFQEKIVCILESQLAHTPKSSNREIQIEMEALWTQGIHVEMANMMRAT